MFKLLLTLTCFLTLSLKAELKLYLDFTLNDKDALLQLDEALRVGNELRNALKILKDSPDKQKEFKDLESKLKTYEDEHEILLWYLHYNNDIDLIKQNLQFN